MDDLQQRVVEEGLAVLAPFGFVLAGGYALQAHGLVDRMSEDVDLFTDQWDTGRFAAAINLVVGAYQAAGWEVCVLRQADTFARLQVRDGLTGRTAAVDLAADARSGSPAVLSMGPVLSEQDAVGAKVAALFSRGEARDYLDVAGILESGRYDLANLEELAARSDPGFRAVIFAEALAAVDRFPDEEFARYGIEAERVREVREVMNGWSAVIRRQLQVGSPGPGQSVDEAPAWQPPSPGSGPTV